MEMDNEMVKNANSVTMAAIKEARTQDAAGVIDTSSYDAFVESVLGQSEELTAEVDADDTARQQAYICNTIEKGWEDVKFSMRESCWLKSADDLLSELTTLG